MRFSGKSVIVTGASRGIGRAAARLFASEGARVVVHYHRDRAAALETLRSLAGGPHAVLPCNLADPPAVASFAERAIEISGPTDVLVNNAGIYELHPILRTDYATWLDVWDRTLRVNLIGPANLMFAITHHMLVHGGGRIVNVSSRGAFRGEPDAPAYGAAKAGLNALGQSLARALGAKGVYVYTIAPGFVETDMVTPLMADSVLADAIRAQSPLGRIASPEEIARTIAFLAAEGSEYLTGCIVDQNGASYLRS